MVCKLKTCVHAKQQPRQLFCCKAMQCDNHTSSHHIDQCIELFTCLLCRLPGFNAQMLSNVIWACATMGFADDAVFIEAAAQATIQMGKHLREQVRAITSPTACFKCLAGVPSDHRSDCLTPSLHQSENQQHYIWCAGKYKEYTSLCLIQARH